MIRVISTFLTKTAGVLTNSYPPGTDLVTKGSPTDRMLPEPNKKLYTREEIVAIKSNNKMDLPTFIGQEVTDYFVLLGSEVFIRKVVGNGLYYQIEGHFIETHHDREGNHKVQNIIEVHKDVIHERFKRPSVGRLAA